MKSYKIEPKYTLTIFTPAYNAAKTIRRTYKSLCNQTCRDFVWIVINDGSNDETEELLHSWIKEDCLHIIYLKKENGGLHTGYNWAIEHAQSELIVCIDADDFMPHNAVEIILNKWNGIKDENIAGIIGLDYYSHSHKPIGGYFSDTSTPYHFLELGYRLKHYGDTKMVLRTDLLKPLIPMQSYPGEKNFNPIYLFYLIDPNLKYVLINQNLCFVDYQPNGMSANIFKQFKNSPRSFAEIRKAALNHPIVPLKRKFIEAAHLVSSSLIARDLRVAFSSPKKFLTLLSAPLGAAFYFYILYKNHFS